MKIHKRNKRYCFKEDRLELCFFVNVKQNLLPTEINPTVMEMSVFMARWIRASRIPNTPNTYFSRHL